MLELKQRRDELPAKYARRDRRIADHIDPKHDNLMAIKFRDGFRSRSLKRHLSVRDDTGKTSFELIYKRFTDIDRFEQKKQKKNRSDPFDSDSSDSSSESESDTDATPKTKKKKKRVPSSRFESDDSTSSSSEDELIRKKKMRKKQARKVPIKESIDELKKTVDLLKSSSEAAVAVPPGRTGRKLAFPLNLLETATPAEPEVPIGRSIDELKNLLTSRLDCREPIKDTNLKPNTYEAEADAVGQARQYPPQQYPPQQYPPQQYPPQQYLPQQYRRQPAYPD